MSARPPRPSMRGRLVSAAALVAALGGAAWLLELEPLGWLPSATRLGILREFLAAALHPATTFDAPQGPQSLLPQVGDALRRTFVFAVSAVALSLVAGCTLGLLASRTWWERRAGRGRRWSRRGWWSLGALRAFLVGLRSVHELFWALLFLAAFGLSPATAVLAIALPYTGGLAKVFSEMLDEAPQRAADALELSGAHPTRAYLVGVVPRALPDVLAYTFYRLECAVRSSAVLGFFGYATLGYHFVAYFENVRYEQAWTYLYVTVGLVLVLEAWSLRLRRGLIG